MSSFYIFVTLSKTRSTLNPLTGNLDAGKYMIENIKTYPTENHHVTSKKYVDDETRKLLDLDANRQLKGDLDMGDNSIVGILDIAATNSVSSKSYIDGELAKRLPLTGGTIDGNVIFSRGNIVMDATSGTITALADPSRDKDAATKKYVDDKDATQNTNITSLTTRVTSLEAKKGDYSFALPFSELTVNTWKYGNHKFGLPNYWHYCKGLGEDSYFHLHVHTFDSDNSIPSSLVLEYKVDAFDTGGNFYSKNILDRNINASGIRVTGENVFVLDRKYYFKNINSAYKNFTTCRLGIRRTSAGTFGNESTLTFSIRI